METAVVTGAGRGIGREIARGLAARGYAVLATDLDERAASETAGEIGGSSWAMAQDVRDPDSHRAVAAAAMERGPLAVWVNNAGVLRTEKAWEHTDEDVRLTVEVNLMGVIWGSRAAVEAMREAGGRIINMDSISAFGPVPGLTVYAATKHAVLGFSLSLQGDLDEAGIPIRVHAVCPKTVDTGMVREQSNEAEAGILFSLGRLLTPAEVAERAVALLDGKRLVLAIPRRRAWLQYLSAPYPRLSLRVLSRYRRTGERKRPAD